VGKQRGGSKAPKGRKIIKGEGKDGGGGISLKTPGRLHGRHACPNHAHRNHYPAHPDVGAQFAHDQVAGTVEDDIADVEQGQAGGYLFVGEVQNVFERVTLGTVHCLSETHIGADGRAEKVEDPEWGDDSAVEFPKGTSVGHISSSVQKKLCVCVLEYSLQGGSIVCFRTEFDIFVAIGFLHRGYIVLFRFKRGLGDPVFL